jgi:hypothetical protein
MGFCAGLPVGGFRRILDGGAQMGGRIGIHPFRPLLDAAPNGSIRSIPDVRYHTGPTAKFGTTYLQLAAFTRSPGSEASAIVGIGATTDTIGAGSKAMPCSSQ